MPWCKLHYYYTRLCNIFSACYLYYACSSFIRFFILRMYISHVVTSSHNPLASTRQDIAPNTTCVRGEIPVPLFERGPISPERRVYDAEAAFATRSTWQRHIRSNHQRASCLSSPKNGRSGFNTLSALGVLPHLRRKPRGSR